LWIALDKISLETLLEKAKELEKRYEWLDAIDFYEQASSLVSEGILTAAELRERIGFCFFKAALQADTNDVFRDRMGLAVKAYEETVELVQSVEKNGECAKISHVEALVAYVSSWLERDWMKKGKLLNEWWRLENEALEEYEKDGDLINIGKTCNNLLEFSLERFWLPTDFQDIKRVVDELLNLGEKSIKILSDLDDDYELARAYCFTGFYYAICPWWIGGNKDRVEEVSIKYSQKALMHSEKIADSWLSAWAQLTVSGVQFFIKGNTILAIEHAKNALKHAKITKDHKLLAEATCMLGLNFGSALNLLEKDPEKRLNLLEKDPEKRKERIHKSIKLIQESIDHYHTIDLFVGRTFRSYKAIVTNLKALAQSETDIKSRTEMLNKAVEVGYEGIKYTDGYVERRTANAISALIEALYTRAVVETKNSKKQRLLKEALEYCIKENEIREREKNNIKLDSITNQSNQVFIYAALAKVEQKKEKKIELLTSCLASMEKAIKLVAKDTQVHHLKWLSKAYGTFCYRFGTPLNELYTLTKDVKFLSKAIEVYKTAVESYTIADTRSQVAEAYWQIAMVYDLLGERLESARNYQLASENYKLAAEKIPQLKEFYNNYYLYMQAWSQIEQARYFHSIEDYEEARQHYEKAALLHESIGTWSYLTPNYFAWANMEEAEGLSRKENAQQAKQVFQKALDQFTKAEETIKQRIMEITSAEERGMTQRLLQSSALRRKFCQARIQIEDAKLLDREGKYLQSSQSYGEAEQNILSVVEKLESEAERKELEYVAILCRAWGKMANAEETSSLESYVEAASLFEQAKDRCYTKKASLWALGNSSFCKGLAAGLRYKSSMDLRENALAKRYINDAATSYQQAGFASASEYARATLRLFDAYVFMNQAEGEVDPEKKTRQYQMAENLLKIAADLFKKARQPEKTAQVQGILGNVREEKALAVSLYDVMHAPTIASTTLSFTAPSPTSEVSVGLEQFEHSNVQANLIAGMKEVKIGESFCLTVEFINAGKEPALLTRVDDFVPSDFIVVKKPEIYRLEESCLNMKGKQIAPLKLVEAKLVLQPSKKGIYQLSPTVHYLDDLGQNKSLQLKSVEIKVEEVMLPDRISTGTKEIDSLLLGGIPKEYAVVLSGPPSDEREVIIKNFLEAGIQEAQTSFYVATEAVGVENLLEESRFYLFLCNPKPKVDVPDLPNVSKLRSKTDINNLNMALARESRNLQIQQSPKRLCVEIVSDVLLEYGSKTTRKWLAELITELASKGFTVLAVINPKMHAPDQTGAILDLFDGEISITQTDDPLECKKQIQVKKLRGQDYIKNPICLT
jgi:tetratricopeptide (TPR) repeat protein/KaiC/GvpD/RAD55 family RecA-like ATPase